MKQSWWMSSFSSYSPFLSLHSPIQNTTSGSFHYLLTPCQQGCSLQHKGCVIWDQDSRTDELLSQPTRPWQTHTSYTQYATAPRPGDEAFAPGFTEGNGNLACQCPYGTLQLCTLKIHSAILFVSHIINFTHQRFVFHAYYFERSPSNILRLGDATVSLTYLCMTGGKRAQKIKSVPWLLTWLV